MSYYSKHLHVRSAPGMRVYCEDCAFRLLQSAAGKNKIYCVKNDTVRPLYGSCRDGIPKGSWRAKKK